MSAGSIISFITSNIANSPIILLVGSGAALLALVSVLMMRRRRSRRRLEVGSTETDEKLLDYVKQHNGAISMSKASKDLGVSSEELGEAIMRLKADGRLQGG